MDDKIKIALIKLKALELAVELAGLLPSLTDEDRCELVNLSFEGWCLVCGAKDPCSCERDD